MRRAQGSLIITDPYASKTLEFDTFTCSHCNSIVVVQLKAPPEELGGFCKLCMKNVCKNCVGKGCDPFEKKLERMESRANMLKALGV